MAEQELSLLITLKDQATQALNTFGSTLENNRRLISQASTAMMGLGAAIAAIPTLAVLTFDKTNNPFKDMSDAVLQLRDALGSAIIPALQQVADAVIPIIYAVTNWIDNNRQLVGILGTAAIVLGTIMIAVGTFGHLVMWLVEIQRAWAIVTQLATAAQVALNIAMDANPVGMVIIAIGALAAGIAILLGLTNSLNGDQQQGITTTDQLTASINAQNKAIADQKTVADAAHKAFEDWIASQNSINYLQNMGINPAEFASNQQLAYTQSQLSSANNAFNASQASNIGWQSHVGAPRNDYSFGGGAVNNVNITVQGSVTTQQDLINAIQQGLLQTQKTTGSLGFTP